MFCPAVHACKDKQQGVAVGPVARTRCSSSGSRGEEDVVVDDGGDAVSSGLSQSQSEAVAARRF